MTKQLVRSACVSLLMLTGIAVPYQAAAQDVAITNARVIVGTGAVIESGTIIVRGGKIASVSPGAAGTQGLRVIDARGAYAVITPDGLRRLKAAYPTHLRGVREHLINRLEPHQIDAIANALGPLTADCPAGS